MILSAVVGCQGRCSGRDGAPNNPHVPDRPGGSDTDVTALGASEVSVVRARNELLKCQNGDEIDVTEVVAKAAADIELPELPATSAENYIGPLEIGRTISKSLSQAHDLEGDLLFGCSAHLLPFQRDQDRSALRLSDHEVDFVGASAPQLTVPAAAKELQEA